MKNFLKYPSLQLPEVATFKRLPEDIAEMEWYALEKLNGTNVSIVLTEKDGFEYFNRRIELSDPNKVAVLEGYVDNGLGQAMKDLLTIQKYKRVHVFGELFGAGIHKMSYDLNKEGLKDFKAFSVFLYKGCGLYDVLTLKQLQAYFSEFLAPLEAKGTLFEMLTLDKDAVSHFGGEREGYVIMPVKQVVYDTNLDTPFFNGIKVKYGKYAEKSKERVRTKAPLTFTEEESNLLEELAQYSTVARVLNIKSQNDLTLEKKNIGSYLILLNDDILKEFPDEISDTVDKYKVLTTLKKTLSQTIIEAINEDEVVVS